MNTFKKQITGICISIIILAAGVFIPGGEILSQTGIRTIAMLLGFLILLIFEALPVMLVCLIFLVLMPLLKVTASFQAALTGFSNPVVFFILASFGIAAAFTGIPLSKRLLALLLKKSGKNAKSVIFALMICTAAVSSVVSNVPCCAIFMAISITFLDLYTEPEEKKKTGRTLMIAIPVASMIGGMMTPAGSSVNLLAISLLERHTGKTISFVQWMTAGIPLNIILIPLACFIICTINKPSEIKTGIIETFINRLEIPEKLIPSEIKTLVITGIMLAFWILSSWYRGINIMITALAGCCVFCLPGINVLKFKTFLSAINWQSFFLVGTVLSLGGAMVDNRVSDWLISNIPAINLPPALLIAFIVSLTFLLLIFIPVSVSLLTFMALPFITLAEGMGVAPQLVMLSFGLCVANCYLLPLDTVPLLTYSTGYYSMLDLAKTTLPIQIIIIILLSIWIPFAGKIFGM